MMVCSAVQTFFFLSFTRFHLLMVGMRACANGVLFGKLSPVPVSSRLFPNIPSIMFSISGFTLIHLELSLVQDDKYGYTHRDTQIHTHTLVYVYVFYMQPSSLTSTICWSSVDETEGLDLEERRESKELRNIYLLFWLVWLVGSQEVPIKLETETKGWMKV